MRDRRTGGIVVGIVLTACAGGAISYFFPRDEPPALPSIPKPGVSTAELTVKIRGVEGGDGNLRMAIYADAESFRKKENPSRRHSIEAREFDWVMTDLPIGEYAIAVFHDRNGNQKLDKNVFGKPVEPYVMSNNARGSAFGPPTFETARFRLAESGRELTLRFAE